MLRFRRLSPLDAVIAAVLLAVLCLGAYLGYAVWADRRSVAANTPASREIEALNQKIKKRPNDVDLRMQLAQALVVAGRDDEAIDTYALILASRKDFTPALSGLGFIYMKRHDWAVGERWFQRVVDVAAGKPDANRDAQLEIAYFYLGTAEMEQHKYDAAVAQFKRALRMRTDASDTWYALSVCYRELNYEDEQLKALRAALAFEPLMPEANYDLGQVLLKRGDQAGAAEAFRISADSAPSVDKPIVAMEPLGKASDRLAAARRLEKTDPKKALIECRIAVALDPGDTDGRLLLASLYEKTNDKEKAAEAYRVILTTDASNVQAAAGLKRVTK